MNIAQDSSRTVCMSSANGIHKFFSVCIKCKERIWNVMKENFILYTSSSKGSRDSSVNIATGYGLDDQVGWEFKSR
jgi:hypothetical protein